ncbi:tubulin-specific chaperone [Sporothrix brasiliensis 5110]|uniref:Tubulin-specific chaperone n=1 Tax=Sporothrix brasiliensis 5110 TaxID=1398154 RepID=A0A0C2ER93_9PEZI|nr:tubulin-specific chaperone [Sporothrix brasiliensis 5110]KIH88904.1 tubulin-specific chaperone [Sporothrix brasiliensis 5110]
MDANDEDDDVRLQRIAGDLLSDFDGSLESFLFKPAPAVTAYGSTKTKGLRVRARVRSRETARMANLLEHFQELPQLLDVHLARWLPMLADAFLQSVERNSQCSAKANATAAAATAAAFAEAATASHGGAGASPSTSSLVMPLQAAVARLLYTVCKVRSEKVVVGFLPVETRHLEPLLGALEAQAADISGQPHSNGRSSTSNSGNDGRDGNEHGSWTWQERYLVLLWLSQLLLAPFDLSTISTGRRGQVADEEDEEEGEEAGSGSKHSRLPAVDGFTWPGVDATSTPITIPSITLRVLPLAVRYLAVPGKERDAARALLVRIAMRRDMQELGIRQALVRWALGSLDGRAPAIHQPYYYIGTLSFLAGILSAAAGASDMDDALASIFAAVNAVADEDGPEAANAVFAAIRSSALARKMMIKASRAVAVRYIQLLDQLGARGPDTNPGLVEAADGAIETTIGYLLGRLADNDTPVRFAASKALSIITLRLRPDMAAQVSDAVLEALERNVVAQNGKLDLTAVDPLEWHGLMLTLAHLVYRRSPPLDALPAIVRALQRGLAFERRSVSGGATGTNVRDAACFGIWALARRYTTAELLPLNVLQTLATDLVVAGSLDPAGNIRRGSSAALQELIGRHPDTICEGIPLVQAVDYHAVALRSRAVTDVAQRATALARSMYGVALRDALLGWRGFADAGDAGARRTAAQSFGQVTLLMAMAEEGRGPGTSPLDYFAASVRTLVGRVESLQARQVEERHGFLLALAAVLDIFPSLVEAARETEGESSKLTELCLSVLDQLHQVLHKCKALSAARRPDLLAEAASRLIVSSFPIVQAAVVLRGGFDWTQGSRSLALLSGPALLAEANLLPATLFHKTVVALDSAFASGPRTDSDSASSTTPHTALQAFVNLAAACLSGPNAWLGRQETDVIAAASDAALILLVALGPSPVAPAVPSTSTPSESPVPPTRDSLVSFWSSVVCRPKAAAAVSFKARASGSGTTGTGYVFALTKAFSLHEISRTTATLEGSATGDDDPISRALLGRWAADRSIDTRIALLQALAQCPAVLMQRATTAPSVSSASVTPAAPGSRFRLILAAGLDDYTTDARGDVGSHVRMHALRATQVLWSQEAVLGEGATPKPAGASILFFRVLRLAAEKLDRVRVAAQATLAQAVGGERSTYLQSLPFSSQAYFRCLLGLWEDVADDEGGSNILSSSTTSIAAAAAKSADGASPSLASAATKWMAALMRGYVTSADTGNEELVVASRAAMVDYIVNSGGGHQQRQSRQQCLWQALLRNLPGSSAAATTAAGKVITPPDRIVVPTLEIIAFLFNAGVFLPPASTGSNPTTTPCHADLLDLSRQVNEAVEKAGSVRKVEACVKVYGAVAAASDRAGSSVTVENKAAGTVARAKLAELLQHPWPRVRNAVVDELWGLGLGQGLGVSLDTAAGAGAGPDPGPAAFDILKGVDWVAADTAALQALAGELDFV